MPPLRVTVDIAIVSWIIPGQRSLLRGSPPFRSGQPPFLGDGRVPGWEVLPPSGEFTVALFCEPHTSAQGNSPFQSCYTHAATPMGWAADGRASQLLLATVGLFLAVFPWACSGEFTAALPPSGESGSPPFRLLMPPLPGVGRWMCLRAVSPCGFPPALGRASVARPADTCPRASL